MPLTIPPFVQYQSPMFPLRGLWNRAPVEGDQFVNVEIDWLVSPPGNAVQFSLSGNSPVAISQIVALYVDNGRSGADVVFQFPDSGFELIVPAHNQGLFPVLTNALMFYAVATAAALGDVTIFQILNSLPPPIPITPSGFQNHVSLGGISAANGSTVLVAAPANGTLNTVSISIAGGTAGQALNVALIDGTGRTILLEVLGLPDVNVINMTGLSIRFFNGLNLVVTNSTAVATLIVNVYYSTP